MRTVNNKNSLRRWTMALSVAIASLTCATAYAQVGTWKAYMSYYDTQQIVHGGQNLFVRASNSLYQYNLTDHSITTYDKIRQLSDNYITHIAWNQEKQKLVVVYRNSNIDLLEADGKVTNVSSLFNKSMTQDKTINHICIDGRFAYFATGFGVVKMNVNKAEISESYILNENIKAVAIKDNTIYAQKNDGKAYSASLTTNLLNINNWSVVTPPSGIFAEDKTDWNEYIETVKTLLPGGPKYNYFNYMTFRNNCLYACGGGWRDGGSFNRPFAVQMLSADKEWSSFDDAQPYNGTRFYDATSIAFDPADDNHFFVSACGTGLYEFKDGKFVKNYTEGNSPLESAVKDNYNYVRVDGLVFDNDGKLWMTCSSEYSNKNSLLSFDLAKNEWNTYNNSELYDHNGKILYIKKNAFRDHQGYIWICNDHHSHPSLLRLDPQTATITRYDNFINQDGATYSVYYDRCAAEDKDGNIWLGTDQGLFMYDQEQMADPALGFTQIKVPRNDGTNYADYLMTGVSITAIAIDGGNRKWIGTDGAGVYLISADNMQQLQHFTSENSNLISDNIESIALNDETGEVFFGTDCGLCSYMSDATVAKIDISENDVYAYPNPVVPGYDGLITIVGLSFDADVKILSTSGRLIAQGRSNGGMFTWNGRDSHGKRVASGVYMVAVATHDGKKGTVCKIAVVN